MEMRGGEDLGIGQDITPPLPPLSFSLHPSFLCSHCSSCFSPLPPSPFPPTPHPSSPPPSSPLYCSPLCSSSDSPLHFHSAEFHLSSPPPSDLRAALRLLHSDPHLHRGRISGLLTNRDNIVADDELLGYVRDGARAMFSARRLRDGKEVLTPDDDGDPELFREEEAALCVILTNAVEVHDCEGRALGIAVYPTTFSWINHSCSANACYRFVISPPGVPSSSLDVKPLIVPAATEGEDNAHTDFESTKVNGESGPRLIVRSIKRIRKNEEVTVAYTDLLQPKAIRQSDLWSKYRFICRCSRCNASPPSYVDHMLQEITTSNPATSSSHSDHSFCREEATRKLSDSIHEIIHEYLAVGDAESCCKKLENLLIIGLLDETAEKKEQKPQLNLKLHPLNHLALNAYTTLASAYRVQACDLLAINPEMDSYKLESYKMMKTAAAYSFLLASATYHLFCFEPSLIVSVANFCTSAGDSLLTLARSSEHFSLGKYKCSKCSMMRRFEAALPVSEGRYEDLESISIEYWDCVSDYAAKVWGSLSYCSDYLKMFINPTDFVSPKTLSDTLRFEVDLDRECRSEGLRINAIQLGAHCLFYGKFLAGICYNR